MKKVAIFTTIIGLIVMGASAGVVMAEIALVAQSVGNHFEASVDASSETPELLLSDRDESRQVVVTNSLYATEVDDQSWMDAGYIDVYNGSDQEMGVAWFYDGPSEGDTGLYWILRIRDTRDGTIVYEGPVDFLGKGDVYGAAPVLAAYEEVTFHFETKLARPVEETDQYPVLDFNLVVQGGAVYQ